MNNIHAVLLHTEDSYAQLHYIHVKVSSYIARYPVLKCFTLHPLADLFIPRPFQLLWEAFSHAAITAQRLFIHISTTVFIARYSFIQLSELKLCGVIKLEIGFEWGTTGISIRPYTVFNI